MNISRNNCFAITFLFVYLQVHWSSYVFGFLFIWCFLCQFSYLIVHDLKGIAYMTSIVTSPLLLDAIGRSLFRSYNITWIFYFLSKPFKRINILNIFSTLSDFVFWRLSFNWYCMLPLSKLSEYIYGVRLHISTCLST